MNLPIGMDAANLSGHPFVPSQAPSQIQGVSLNPENAGNVPPIPVKVEKTAPSASSKKHNVNQSNNVSYCMNFSLITEKRKEPPDSDTKPSSSSIGESVTNKSNGQKRQRRLWVREFKWFNYDSNLGITFSAAKHLEVARVRMKMMMTMMIWIPAKRIVRKKKDVRQTMLERGNL
jgi:hypothetical protein